MKRSTPAAHWRENGEADPNANSLRQVERELDAAKARIAELERERESGWPAFALRVMPPPVVPGQYLLQGGESPERFELLLSLRRTDSDDVKSALWDHLVRGYSSMNAAVFNGLSDSNFARAVRRLNATAATVERIKELDWARFKSDK